MMKQGYGFVLTSHGWEKGWVIDVVGINAFYG